MSVPDGWRWAAPEFVVEYHVLPGGEVVCEKARSYDGNPSFSFEELSTLSDLFGTRKIDVGTELRDDGYCETCSDPYAIAVVTIRDIARWP